MELIQEIWTFISNELWPHWPGLMFILIITIVAQTLKTRVLTAELAKQNTVVFWIRRIFPLILLSLGIPMGILWPGEVVSGVSLTAHKVFYFMGCSGVSIVGFNIFKQWIKKKYDIDISLNSTMPPE